VKKHLTDYFGVNEKRIKVFNNFIDPGEIPGCDNSDNLKAELKIPQKAYLIGYAGRFSIKEKGIDILINAFKPFSKKHPDSFLLMVGGGEDIKNIPGIPENVIILQSRENIFDYYRIFDCLVLPSRVDPFPLTALETGMMKIPFIGSDVNGITEIIEDGIDGLLFGKENTEMLFQKLEKYYNDKGFANECAENLYKKVTDKYNVKSALKILNKIYEEL
jgi:glycosyltransferase involved in cell wall biosynthesis